MKQIIQSVPEWESFAGANWCNEVMSIAVPDREHRKQGRAIGRWTLVDAKRKTLVVYLKRHFRLSLWHGLLSRVLPGLAWSPGLQEWHHLKLAERIGLPVPRACAAGEIRGPGLQLQSFLAVEELHGMEPLHLLIPEAARQLTSTEFMSWKRGLLHELARLCRELHEHRLFHKDLYLCHFYLHVNAIHQPPESWHNRIIMIDFHRLARHRLLWPWFQLKDLAQLLYSSKIAGVTRQDQLRFWLAYCGGTWSKATPPPHWLRRGIAWKAERYQRHHDKTVFRQSLETVK